MTSELVTSSEVREVRASFGDVVAAWFVVLLFSVALLPWHMS